MNVSLPAAAWLGFFPILTIGYWVTTLVVHLAFAYAVDSDAANLGRSGRRLVFVGRFLWALATLVGGPLVAAAYWVVHHSSLRAIESQSPISRGEFG